MTYDDFTLEMLTQQFGLRVVSKPGVFALAPPASPSALLEETLADTLPLALSVGTEKARSEFIIAPVLAEARRQLGHRISVFSGVDFTVDPDVGLGGVCDYLLSLSPLQLFVQAPVVAVVEAKNDNIKSGLGKFLRLSGTEVIVDEEEYYIQQPQTILGILVFMVREALEQQGDVSL